MTPTPGTGRNRRAVRVGMGALMALLAGAGDTGGQSLDRDIEWGYQQFLTREYRPFWDERYENLSFLSYRNFPIRGEQPRYDPFGLYLLDGSEILRIEEYRTLHPGDSSRIPTGPNFGQFRNLVIMKDHYGSWSTRLMLGQRLKAHLSPLSHARATFDGIRWDASSHRNMISILTSRVSHRPARAPRTIPFGTYLYGGRWQSQLGDIATFGATYADVHLRDTTQRKGDFRGVFPKDLNPADSYFVIVSDDSPEDGVGPLVYAVEMWSRGRRVEAQAEARWVLGSARADDVAHIRRNGSWAVLSMEADRLLKPVQPGRGRFYSSGIPAVVDGRGTEVAGTDLLVFRFDAPAEPEDLHFRVLASGDYNLDLGASYVLVEVPDRAWSDWHNVVRAPGNVRDGSNLGWVDLRYGFPTGLANLGADIEINLWDVEMKGEYVHNTSNYQVPIFGDHFRQRTAAWYLKGVRRMGEGWRLGGEIHHMPSDYVNSLPMWSHSARKVLAYRMVEDNDDRDEWPDEYEHWDPLHPTYIINKRNNVDVDALLSEVSSDYGFGGDFTYGVYPGLDADQDGQPDTNVNRNEFADYVEPFLMYYVEPDEFVYGDDFNNNGVVDGRENDNRPDYPYPLDTDGYHVFGSYRGAGRVGARLGRYEVHQTAGDGRNEVSYAEARYRWRMSAAGSLDLRYRLRRVRDDIPDPTYITVVEPLSATNRATAIHPDRLLTRNSLVNTVYAESFYSGVDGLTVVNATKVDVNRRLDDRQGRGRTITDWTWVSKADYAVGFSEHLTFTPMAKLLVQRLDGPGDLITDRHTWEWFPILRLDIAFSKTTGIRTGVQGFPFKHRYRHAESRSSNFDARHYVFTFHTRRSYTGYSASINVGLRRSREQLINLEAGSVRDFTQFFVQARIL